LSNYQVIFRLAFFILAFFTTLAYFNFYYMITNQAKFAEWINLSGKQRMFSQKILTEALYVCHRTNEQDRPQLERYIEQMRKEYQYLLSQELPSSLHAYYFSPPNNLNHHISEFLRSASSACTPEEISKLTEQQNHLLNDLDTAVSIYENESRQLSKKIQIWSLVITLMTLLLLYIIARYIFNPMFDHITTEHDREQEIINRLSKENEQKNKQLNDSLKIINQYVYASKTDPQGIITEVSDAFCEVSGYSRDELLGNTHRVVKHPDNTASVFRMLWTTITQGLPYFSEVKNLSKSGEELWFNSYIYPEFDDNGKISGYVALRHNITDKKKLEKLNLELEDRIQERTKELEISNGKLQELSRTDPLTKVFNRRYFEEKVMIEINRATRYDLEFSVILLDIDHFKMINDTYGHLEGDRILIQIARIMAEMLRNSDTVARWGGEEFVILLPEQSLQNGIQLAERLRTHIEKSYIDDLQVTASMGVAVLDHGDTLSSLFTKVDKALYRAKELGRNRVIPNLPMLDNDQ